MLSYKFRYSSQKMRFFYKSHLFLNLCTASLQCVLLCAYDSVVFDSSRSFDRFAHTQTQLLFTKRGLGNKKHNSFGCDNHCDLACECSLTQLESVRCSHFKMIPTAQYTRSVQQTTSSETVFYSPTHYDKRKQRQILSTIVHFTVCSSAIFSLHFLLLFSVLLLSHEITSHVRNDAESLFV